MPDLPPIVLAGAVVLVALVAVTAYGHVLQSRQTPEERALDGWLAQRQIIDAGYKGDPLYSNAVKHYSPGTQADYAEKLANYRALRDAGMSMEGAAIEVLGAPPFPVHRNRPR